MNPRHLRWLAAGLTFACQAVDHDQERCTDVTAQIEQALTDYTDSGVLLPGAEPCELTEDSFDPRTQRESQEYLLDAFASACQTRAEVCEGVPAGDRPQRRPPPATPPPFVSVTRSAPE
jgi:hypothetical protein